MRFNLLPLIFAALLLSCTSVNCAVSGVSISERSPVLNGRSFGTAGPYERIRAKVEFAVDPNVPANAGIVDLKLAPRNSRGLVTFTADMYILRPVNTERGNGTALVEIPNRGGKGLLSVFDFAEGSKNPQSDKEFGDGFLLNHGFTLVWIGWEFDVPRQPDVLALDAPVVSDAGTPITGMVRSEWIGDDRVNTISLGDRNQIGYPVSDAQDPANKLYVRDRVDGERTAVDRSTWHFSDPTHVTLASGFQPGHIYEVVYRAKNPVVAGLGFAAVRDFVSLLRNAGVEIDSGGVGGSVKRTIGFGISQVGRFLRDFLYQGFNADEQGRTVFDGVWAHVGGAGRGSFNQRFAQPSRDGHPFMNVLYPVDVPPFTADAILKSEREKKVAPKLMLTNGSYEYWGRCASLIHTTPDGKHDVEPEEGTRIYFLAGSQHGAGSIPPHRTTTQNLASVNDYRCAQRALLIAMQDWVTEGKEPPPSKIPTIRREELVDLQSFRFPAVPGVMLPRHTREAYQLDFSVEPPRIGAAYVTLVPQVDRDGNEIAGIRMPEISVPLASNTGWNLREPSVGAPTEMYSMIGSWIPFALTKAQRQERGDPRSAVEERYRSREDYLAKLGQAAESLVKDRYLLDQDVPRLRERAEKEWNYIHGLPAN